MTKRLIPPKNPGGIPLVIAVVSSLTDLAPEEHQALRHAFRCVLVYYAEQWPSTPVAVLIGNVTETEKLIAETAAEWSAEVVAYSDTVISLEDFAVRNCHGLAIVSRHSDSALVDRIRNQCESSQLDLHTPQLIVLHEISPEFRESAPTALPGAASERRHILKHLDGLNSDVIEVAGTHFPVTGDLIPDPAPFAAGSPIARIAAFFWQADRTSSAFSKKTRWTAGQLILCALLAFLGLDLYGHSSPHQPWLLVFYPSALLIGYFIQQRSQKSGWEVRYQDFRALAEGLRVQFYWLLAGLDDNVADVALPALGPDEVWIHGALRAARLVTGPPSVTTGETGVGLAHRHWVASQAAWLKGKQKHRSQVIRYLEEWSGWLLAGVGVYTLILCAVMILPVLQLEDLRRSIESETWHTALLMCVPLPTVAVGLFRFYFEHSGYSEQAREYKRAARVFESADTAIASAFKKGNFEECRRILRALGADALAENGEWWLVRKDRRLRPFVP